MNKNLIRSQPLKEAQPLTIALIGQVNVGKSTLFNSLIGEQKAIIDRQPGTTRDRNYGRCQWRGENLMIIDTGGLEELEKKSNDQIGKQVKKQIIRAIKESDLIFFIIEIRPPTEIIPESDESAGPPISNFEREINRLIKKSKKPTILVLNKADNPQKRKWAQGLSWLKLGFNQPFAISATNGTGVGDLLDEALKRLPLKSTTRPAEPTPDQKPIKVAIMGRPNVGKSTLLNSLLGEEKVIVSPLPHTTRGPQDTLVQIGPDRQSFLLIDTAGIRKQAKVKTGIEKIGVQQSLKIIQKSDIILMLLDVTGEISHQDKTLLRLIIKNKKGLIIIINKCDLLTKQNLNRLIKTKVIHEYLPLARWAPIIFISAKTQQNVNRVFSLIKRIQKNKYI